MSRNFNPALTIEDVEKAHVYKNEVVAFDTDLYHVRLENIGRSKSINNIFQELTKQIMNGTVEVPITREEKQCTITTHG